MVEPDKAIRDTIYPSFGLGGDMDGEGLDFTDGDMTDVDFTNIDFGDLKLGEDFDPDEFLGEGGLAALGEGIEGDLSSAFGVDFGADMGADMGDLNAGLGEPGEDTDGTV